MASLKQIAANQRNAQKSTGPKTEAGKNASKLNAIRHGLSSNLFLVEHEDAAEFEAFRDDFFTEHAPAGPTETFLVEQMIAAAWRIRRIHVTEAAFWDLKMAQTDETVDDRFENPPKSRYLAYAHEGRFGLNSTANNLARYESRLESAFYKALHELERLRREQPPVPQPAPEIGFVSPAPKIVPRQPAPTEPPPPALCNPTAETSLPGTCSPATPPE